MEVTKPYEFIGFWAMEVTKPYEFLWRLPACSYSVELSVPPLPRVQPPVARTPSVRGGLKPYEFIGFGAMEVTKPYEFIGFGAMEVTKPYEFYRVWGHGGHQTL